MEYESERVAGFDHDATHGDPDGRRTIADPGAARRVPGSWGCAMQQVCAHARAGDLDTSIRRSRVNRH